MKVKIRVFAGLKDFFQADFFVELNHTPNATVDSIKKELLKIKPESTELISLCRFAAGTEFVDENYEINEGDIISFLPPSSGG